MPSLEERTMSDPIRTPAVSMSTKQLLVSTAVALIAAAVVLVIAVLPAEFGIDPTGAGRLLGLTAMASAEGDTSVPVMHAHPRKARNARIEIRVAPNEELEYKALLELGEPMLYAWTVEGGPVYFEFHGEPTQGEWPEDYYRSYEIQERSSAAQGSFVAPFTGNHGWYWRNLSSEPATIVLEASGYYSKLARVE
jgi:hypothetical protein